MFAPTVFCSHCGVSHSVASTAGGFALHCSACGGLSLGLTGSWAEIDQEKPMRLPLAPMIRYEEKEFACASCEGTLSMELTFRSSGLPCAEHSQNLQKEGVSSRSGASLSSEEIAFFTSPTSS